MSRKLSPEKLLGSLKSTLEQQKTNDNSPVVRTLSQNKVSNPLLLIGDQQIRIKRTIDWIRSNLFADSPNSISVYFGSELTSEKAAAHIVQDLSSMSLFASEQLIVIYNADKIRARAADAIAEGLKRGAEQVLLVLTAEKYAQKNTFFSRLDNSHTIVEYKAFSPAVLKRWLDKEARINGTKGFESGAAELLIQSYGNDVSALSREMSKLCLLCAPDSLISKALVTDLSKRTPEAQSFQLVDTMAKGNVAASMTLASRLLDQGLHPLQLNSFLSRAFRTLLAARGSIPETSDSSGIVELSSELSNGWFLRNLRTAQRRFSTAQLSRALSSLAKLDFQLKDSGLPDNELVFKTVRAIAMAK